jgi:aldehyde:ferredoxin oxidoreductase
MVEVKGYSAICARIDLTTGVIKKEVISEKILAEYIGGYGLIAKVLWDELKPGTDALDPSNPLIYAIGPFPGTIVPTSSKYAVGAKSPLTRRIGFSISSGSVGAQMRRAGYTMVIITGKAPEPVFLMFQDDVISIIPCKNTLWGKDSWQAEDEIRNMFSDQRIAVASIGQGGEHLVKFACITNDRNRQAGRTGMGAVMGSKNLKALAFRGTKSIAIAKPKEFMEKAKELIKIANSDKTYKYRDLGTPVNTLAFNKIGCLPTKNFQTGYWDKAEALSGETMAKKWVTKKAACSQCPIACDHLCTVPDTDPDWPGVTSSVDYESLYALGSVCLVDHFPALIKAIELCDRFGIDTMSAGVTLGFGMEAYEKGFITKEMLGNNPVYKDGFNWGNYKALVQMVEDVAFRKTKAGDILAEGSRGAAIRLDGENGESIKFTAQIKGLEIPGYEMKALSTTALGFAVSVRGACHLRNAAYGYDMKGKFDRKIFDKYEERGIELMKNEPFMAVIDSLVVCKFTRDLYARGLQEIAEVYEMVTGIPMDGKKIELSGQRIHDLAKCFNIRECKAEGILDPSVEDTLPWRNFHEGNLDGPTKGWINDEKTFKEAVQGYYKVRGWDAKGIPTEATLKSRGLDFVIGKL